MKGGLFENPDNAAEDEPQAIKDARLHGLPQSSIDAIRASIRGIGADPADGLWPENLAVVEAFLAASSQWRSVVVRTREGYRQHFTGLDYAGARAGIEAAGLALSPEIWAGLRIMEAAAREALNGSG